MAQSENDETLAQFGRVNSKDRQGTRLTRGAGWVAIDSSLPFRNTLTKTLNTTHSGSRNGPLSDVFKTL
jgi:hypothetical protein